MKLILFTTGEVTSPNYPNPYYLQKTQTIRVKEGLVLSLQFTAFDIDGPYLFGYCDDHLTITEGDGTTLLEKSCGPDAIGNLSVGGKHIRSSLPADIRSTSNVVNLVFITNNRHPSSGWSVSWSAVTPGECQQCNLVNLLFSFLI